MPRSSFQFSGEITIAEAEDYRGLHGGLLQRLMTPVYQTDVAWTSMQEDDDDTVLCLERRSDGSRVVHPKRRRQREDSKLQDEKSTGTPQKPHGGLRPATSEGSWENSDGA